MQLEVSILEARVYCPMYTIPSRLGSIRHQLQSSIVTVEKLAYCGILQQQMLVAKCAPEHKRFLLQPSMQILSSLDNAVYITSSKNKLLACFLKISTFLAQLLFLCQRDVTLYHIQSLHVKLEVICKFLLPVQSLFL